jgi:hypothetical protein
MSSSPATYKPTEEDLLALLIKGHEWIGEMFTDFDLDLQHLPFRDSSKERGNIENPCMLHARP